MGRHCRGLQLNPSSLCDLEELAAEAKSLGASDVLLRIRGLIMVSRAHSYREVAACLGVTSGRSRIGLIITLATAIKRWSLNHDPVVLRN